MILQYTSEETFKTEDVEIPDEMYDIATSLHSIYKNEDYSKCTPLIIDKDKQSLKFKVNNRDRQKDRVAYELGIGDYIITISPLKNNI